LKEELDEKGTEWLIEELRRLDPEYHAAVDLKNIKRVFHAVEIIRTAGRTYTSLRTGKIRPREFRMIRICLEPPREILFDRINRRVDAMVAAGLEEEARSVYPRRHLNSLNTVGLKEMFAWFDGIMDRDTAIARIKKNTRVYAKKQITWRKREQDWIRRESSGEILSLLGI
ncbi:MAG: tRNA (adenosine(37)-N6)-dimethylallyltransferase MiaA, partial [Muribaculaceae bacterium]|nr:tRNA (adenosine(37)-N6)-dimethylallyltransferase MiaA [Muribaculaceae bacterium]